RPARRGIGYHSPGHLHAAVAGPAPAPGCPRRGRRRWLTGRRDLPSGGIRSSMGYYALFYDVVDDYVARRAAYREGDLRLARAVHRRGELLLGGALCDPPDGALLVFRTPDRSVVEQFARSDPYVTHGLVTRWEVRPWAVVIGDEAEDRAG